MKEYRKSKVIRLPITIKNTEISIPINPNKERDKMDIEEVKAEFGDCDWMRAFLTGYAVDAILWLINRVEELEQEKEKDDKPSI